MYEFDSRVRYSEVDHHGTMTVPALINYFQDCSTFQSEDLGIGTTVLKEEKRAWLLSYWQVILNRKPELGEKITIGTFATEFKGLFGNRNFYMKDADGKYLACANSVWAFINTETGRPTRPQQKDVQLYGVEEPLDIPYEGRKIRLPEETDDLEAFPVRKHHIDTNEHVNNCQYVQMALEFLPDDLQIAQLRVEYKKAAVLGDMIYPKLSEEADRIVVELCDEQAKPYAVLEFKEEIQKKRQNRKTPGCSYRNFCEHSGDFCCEQVTFAGDIYLSRLARTSSRTSSTESVTSSA